MKEMHITRRRIRELAREKGIKFSVICDDMGVCRNYLVDKKQAGNPIPDSRLEKAAERLGTTVEYLKGTGNSANERVTYIGGKGAVRGDVISDKIYSVASRLNTAGQSEWVRYGEFLSEQDTYRKPQGMVTRAIRHYLVPAAAGFASPVDGDDYESLELADVPPDADFCITVDGDSMEPYIQNGSLVFVKRGSDLKNFDVGVFYIDGDVLIKQIVTDVFRNTYLLSANPARENMNRIIMHDSNSVLVCYGKVITARLPQPEYFNAIL